jgi:hypothetical protein
MSAEEEIRRALNSYIRAHDRHAVDEIVALFADDAVFTSSHAGPAGPCVGIAAIRQFYERSRDRQPPGRRVKLLCANSIITVDGASAEALSDVVSLVSDTPDGIWRIDRLVKWRDRFVRRQGTWLYLDKRVLPDLYA